MNSTSLLIPPPLFVAPHRPTEARQGALNKKTVTGFVAKSWVGREVIAPRYVQRFIVLGQARTGSNLLLHLLNRRGPGLRLKGEVLNPKMRPEGAAAAEVLEQAVRWPGNRLRILGCTVFYDQITDPELSELLKTPRLKVVHLQRRNWLRMYVSMEIAHRHDWWGQRTPDGAPSVDERAFVVDVGDLLEQLHHFEANRVRATRHLRDMDVFDVWYEDLSADYDHTIEDVAGFLGAKLGTTYDDPVLQKQNPEPLDLLVRNLDEVEAALAGTPWEDFVGVSE
jgi:hypothetical protein